jgi:hypothetical protein
MLLNWVDTYWQPEPTIPVPGLQASVKQKSTGRFRCLLSGTFPQVLGNYYGSTVNAMQAALVVTGVLPDAPALKRMTPSSFEQKLRTPDWL